MKVTQGMADAIKICKENGIFFKKMKVNKLSAPFNRHVGVIAVNKEMDLVRIENTRSYMAPVVGAGHPGKYDEALKDALEKLNGKSAQIAYDRTANVENARKEVQLPKFDLDNGRKVNIKLF